MTFEEPEKTHIDVGGGKGEFFSERARENPDQMFIVLDPAISDSEDASETDPELQNLQVINWRSDVDSHLPFEKESIDEANANFLMGEIYTQEPPSKTIEEEKEKYARVMRDVFNVLKKEGKVRIVDVQGVIGYVVEVLEEVGFTVTVTPTQLPPEERNMSEWCKQFYDMYEVNGKQPDALVLPMVVEAVKGD